MIYIGIDNGTTGTISILGGTGRVFHHGKMPTKKEQSYTKKKQGITRIDTKKLRQMLAEYTTVPCTVIYERPMINPTRLKASISAARALEAVLVVLEDLQLPYRYCDSKEWQGAMLPKGLKPNTKEKHDPVELKIAACDIARRLFPSVDTKDADSLLMAEYIRRQR